ncbi:hypothetical protein AKJ16_DCAP04947 [Drosera capensis]
MEGLKASVVDLVVYLHPSKTKLLSEAIHHELNSLLLKFNENFDGILLAYELIEVMDTKAKILSGLVPHTSVSLGANLLIFSPKPNMLLEGKVVKMIKRVSRADHKRPMIGVGTMVRFLVKSFDENMLHISGSLVPACTGSVQWLANNRKGDYPASRSA